MCCVYQCTQMDIYFIYLVFTWTVIFSEIKYVLAEYCNVYCESGCYENGCKPETISLVLGFVFGGVALLLLGAGIAIICNRYLKKKAIKKQIRTTNTETENQIIRENTTRTIKMDGKKCRLIIMRKNQTKIVVDVKGDVMTVQKDDDVPMTVLRGDKPPTPQPLPHDLFNTAGKN